jgi:hypothetical protein
MSGLIFFGGEGAAENGGYSQGGKQIGGNASAGDHLSVFAISLGEEARLIVVGSERCKRVILLSPVEEIGIGTLPGNWLRQDSSARRRERIRGC